MTTLLIKVISLLGSPRREAMAKQLNTIGVPWSFFDACTGAPGDLPYNPIEARQRHGRELTPGELGCFASHRTLWGQLVADDQHDLLLVLEDDVLLNPSFFSDMEAVAAAAKPYEYLRLYAKVPSDLHYEAHFLDRHICRFRREAYGTQGYLITPKAAKRFLDSICTLVRPIDDEMDRYWQHKVPIRAIFPFPIMEVNLGSTIEPVRRHKPELSKIDKSAYSRNRKIEQVRRRLAPLFSQLAGTPS